MQDDPIGNINLAMEIAEKHLDIPKMLDAEGELYLTEVCVTHKQETVKLVLYVANFQCYFAMNHNRATCFVFRVFLLVANVLDNLTNFLLHSFLFVTIYIIIAL